MSAGQDEVDEILVAAYFAHQHHGTFSFWTPEGPVDYKDYG